MLVKVSDYGRFCHQTPIIAFWLHEDDDKSQSAQLEMQGGPLVHERRAHGRTQGRRNPIRYCSATLG